MADLDDAKLVLDASDRAYQSAVSKARVDLPSRFADTATICAAHLWATGIPQAARQEECCCQKTLRKKAIRHLQLVGILPAGLAWWFAFALRHAITWFLTQLILEWLRKTKPATATPNRITRLKKNANTRRKKKGDQ